MHNFRMSKARGVGCFEIAYMLATHNKATDSGEFFVEFTEGVYDTKLEECFKSYGVASVNVLTFAHDGGESSSAALCRVLETAEREGVYTTQTGVCPSALMAKAQARREMEAQAQQAQQAASFDEKTQAALKLSLETIAVKMEQHGEISGQIMEQASEANQGIKEILKVKLELLQEQESHQQTRCTMQLARDRTEQKLAAKTLVENTKDVEIKILKDELLHVKNQMQSLTTISSLLQARINEQASTIERQGGYMEANCALVCDVRTELGKRSRADAGLF